MVNESGRGETHAEPVTDPCESVIRLHGLTGRERFRESVWQLAGKPLMRLTFHNWYRIRRELLVLFGADVHPTARVRPSARITHPWKLRLGANTTVGDKAVLCCLGGITVGDRCTISQYAHLCAVEHDYTSRDMRLITDPIVIEDDVWIAADVFVGPGVTIEQDSVVGARSTVHESLPARSVCAGDDAKPLRPRKVRPTPSDTAGHSHRREGVQY